MVVYLGALILSWSVQSFFPTSDKPNLYQQTRTISVNNNLIDHSYYHLQNKRTEETIILFPDLFGRQEFLLPLARTLQDSVNVIIPVYPEKNRNGVSISHSVNKRSNLAKILTDSLDLNDVHLLGHGYGGLIAIDLASDSSQTRYESLVLLSSYGVQELQFLGNHMINRSLYSLLYPVVTIFKYLVPHMGWYHEQPVDFSFVQTLIDLNQRPVRHQLQQIEIPVQILHPLKDRYISLSIAEENHRLIPQSTLTIINGDHMTTEETPSVFARHIFEFLNTVESNQALTRAEATQDRLIESGEPFDADKFTTVGGWTLIIMMLLLAIISLLSEDLACIAGGLLVASGIIDFWYAVLGCCIGVLGGDIGTYLLGRWVGNPILRWIPFRWILNQNDIERAERMFRMNGVQIIFGSRFLPGTRFPTYLVAGMIRINFTFFLGYFILAMIIWAPLLVKIAEIIGQPMIAYLTIYQEQAIWIVPLILLILYGVIRFIILLSTVTGRRKILVKISHFREQYFNPKN